MTAVPIFDVKNRLPYFEEASFLQETESLILMMLFFL